MLNFDDEFEFETGSVLLFRQAAAALRHPISAALSTRDRRGRPFRLVSHEPPLPGDFYIPHPDQPGITTGPFRYLP